MKTIISNTYTFLQLAAKKLHIYPKTCKKIFKDKELDSYIIIRISVNIYNSPPTAASPYKKSKFFLPRVVKQRWNYLSICHIINNIKPNRNETKSKDL